MAAGYPLPAPPPTPRMPGSTRVLLWSLGGCGVLVVLLVAGSLVFGAVVASRMFNLHIGDIAAPADFPVYPGSRMQTGVSMGTRGRSAHHTISLVQWSVPARGTTVVAWYRQHLDEGDWAVETETAGGISFHRRSTGAAAQLQVHDQVAQTLVQLEMTGDQPLAPGAHPDGTNAPSP